MAIKLTAIIKLGGFDSPKKTAEVQHNPLLKGDTTQIHENNFMRCAH